MCFTRNPKKNDLRYAVKDVTVYKVFLKPFSMDNAETLYSPFQKFGYKKGVVYQTDFGFQRIKHIISYVGDSNIKISLTTNEEFIDFSKIIQGFHSYISKKYMLKYWSGSGFYTYVECIIPKGSWYYINSSGEVVSDHLMLKDLVSIFKKK